MYNKMFKLLEQKASSPRLSFVSKVKTNRDEKNQSKFHREFRSLYM
jgi:hypothetical protein